MRKLIKYGFMVAVIIIYNIIVYPILLNRYGDTLVILRLLVNILIVAEVLKFTYKSISGFGLGAYRYYKLLGMREISILVQYFRKHCFRYWLCVCFFFMSVYAGDVVSALLCTVQYVGYCVCLVFVLYILMHEYKSKRVIVPAFLTGGAVCVLILLCQLFRFINEDVGFAEIPALLSDGVIPGAYRAMFMECNIYSSVMAALVMVFGINKLYALDRVSVIEDFTKNKKLPADRSWNRFFGQKKYGLLRSLKITFRNKENLFSYAAAFGLYVFCCCLPGDISILVFWVSCFFIVLINYGLESIYRNDAISFELYKLFGESYTGFLRKKMQVSLVINLIFGSVYTIKCIDLNCRREWILLVLLHITNSLYWNMYYSCLYSGRKLSGTIWYEIKRLIAFVPGILPGLNIGFAILYYKKGRRRWDEYVNNGQCDKAI